jgi:hypothetical protein
MTENLVRWIAGASISLWQKYVTTVSITGLLLRRGKQKDCDPVFRLHSFRHFLLQNVTARFYGSYLNIV